MSPTSISSGLLSADTLVYQGRGTLNYILLTEASEVTIFDGTTGTGNILFQATSTGAQGFDISPVRCLEGIYVVVTSGSCIVYYGG